MELEWFRDEINLTRTKGEHCISPDDGADCGECEHCVSLEILPDPDGPHIDHVIAKAKRVLRNNHALAADDKKTAVILMKARNEMLCLLRPGLGILVRVPREGDTLIEALPECLHSIGVRSYKATKHKEPFFQAATIVAPFDVKMLPFWLKGHEYRMWVITPVTVN